MSFAVSRCITRFHWSARKPSLRFMVWSLRQDITQWKPGSGLQDVRLNSGLASCNCARQIASQRRQTTLQKWRGPNGNQIPLARKTKEFPPIVELARLMPLVSVYENKTPTHRAQFVFGLCVGACFAVNPYGKFNRDVGTADLQSRIHSRESECEN